MALRGVWQLQKLIVSYCDWGGSSRGIMYVVKPLRSVFLLQVARFPLLLGNKNEWVVCVKNLTSDILLHATRLRNALGRKVIKLKTRHVIKHPSVQGTWTTDTKF
ncbi:LOW QUALITY PROTEIN: hypothetical protein CFOL_v3_12396, partial [Cephalotus follicularis]